jgi:hypothetical protein
MRRGEGGEALASFYRAGREVNRRESFGRQRSASSLLSMHRFLGGEATGWHQLRENTGRRPRASSGGLGRRACSVAATDSWRWRCLLDPEEEDDALVGLDWATRLNGPVVCWRN